MAPVHALTDPPIRSGRHRGKGERRPEPFFRLRTDVRSFFLVSMFTYACYDLAVHPILHWFAGLFSR